MSGREETTFSQDLKSTIFPVADNRQRSSGVLQGEKEQNHACWSARSKSTLDGKPDKISFQYRFGKAQRSLVWTATLFCVADHERKIISSHFPLCWLYNQILGEITDSGIIFIQKIQPFICHYIPAIHYTKQFPRF